MHNKKQRLLANDLASLFHCRFANILCHTGKNEFHRLCINNICIAFLTKKRMGDLRETRLSNLHLHRTDGKGLLVLIPSHLQASPSATKLSTALQASTERPHQFYTVALYLRCLFASSPSPAFLPRPAPARSLPNMPHTTSKHAVANTELMCKDMKLHCMTELTSRLRLCGAVSMAHTNTLVSFNTQPLKPEAAPEHKSRLLLLLCTTWTSHCSHSLLRINNFSTQRVKKGRRERRDLLLAQTLQSVAGNQLQQVLQKSVVIVLSWRRTKWLGRKAWRQKGPSATLGKSSLSER